MNPEVLIAALTGALFGVLIMRLVAGREIEQLQKLHKNHLDTTVLDTQTRWLRLVVSAYEAGSKDGSKSEG